MKNIAVIFAGGSGVRMNTRSKPKQFLELRGKPIIIYTLELFDNHPLIDGIVVVCLESWIPFLEMLENDEQEHKNIIHDFSFDSFFEKNVEEV